MECVLGGVLRRTGKERAVLVRSDPQGRFLGCLVRNVRSTVVSELLIVHVCVSKYVCVYDIA